MTHFDFGGSEAGTTVHPLEGDRVELALVQVDHGQLVGFVRCCRGSSQWKLELTPDSLWWRIGVGAWVDGAGLVLGEGVTVGKILTYTQRFVIEGKRGSVMNQMHMKPFSYFKWLSAYLSARVNTGLWPLLQQRVKDDIKLLLVVGVSHHAGQRGVGIWGGGDRGRLGSQNVLMMAVGNTVNKTRKHP